MKRDPAYKPESRLPGLKEIPVHWKVIRNSVIFREINETGYTDLELLSILSDRGVVQQSETGGKERAPEDRSKYKRILKNDIGYNLMNAFVGAIGVSNYDGIISPAYAVCRPKIEINATYFHYLLRTNLYLTEFDRNAYGIMDERNRLYFDNFKTIYVPFPPIHEQRRIVAFINHKLAQIEQFISYKRRLIELLNEQKAVLINRAVTKGLDPDVPMKHSGIEWLGDIPAHWDVTRLKYLAKVQTGVTLGQKYQNLALETRPYLRVANVQDGYLDLSEIKTINLPSSEIEESLLYKGDVLITEKGDFDKLGRGYVWEEQIENCLHQNHIFAVRPDKNYINPYFLAALLSSSHGKNYFIYTSKQTTNLASTNTTILKNLEILLPGLEEQNKILEFIRKESDKISDAIAQAEKEIELIQEYQTTLISDAVTGKIDVQDTVNSEQLSVNSYEEYCL